jgi:hypothetical protein
MEDIVRTTFFVLLAVIALPACGISNRLSRVEFDKSLEQYNELIRWQDLDRAVFFSSPSIFKEFASRAEAAKKAKVTDYQIVDVQYDEKSKEASATVVYSYYMLTSLSLKKLTDNQKWVYTDAEGKKSWKLMSLLPEFK